MRILLVIAHHFRGEKNAAYSSTDERQRANRRRSIEKVLLSWRAHFGESAMLNIEHRMSELHRAPVDRLDVAVVVNEEHHLLDESLERALGVARIPVKLENPRLLPFMAHRVMADYRNEYDWFVYSEDDLLLCDAMLFRKLAAFQARFGATRVLQPNRFEINPKALRLKTYIDGDLRGALVEQLWAHRQESEPSLVHETEFGALRFARARNPHSGFFALSAEQFANWAAQSHFLDMDCSFVSPLESAATLGLLKTFSVYKPAEPNLWHLEIEHLDRKFSNLRLPVLHRGE